MSTLPSNVVSLLGGLEKAASRAAALSPSGGMPFLRLLKSGEWVYGSEDTDVQEGSKWAINPNSFAMGYAAWGEGELLGEEMAPATADPIIKSNLPNVGVEWKPQIAFQLACVSGDDKGQQVLFKATSKGGNDAFKTVLNAVIERGREGHTDLVPIVHLLMDNYKHKTYGRIYTPVFEIVEWKSMDATTADEAEAESEGGEETPAPAAEESKPRRRRRRAAAD